jgi:hypothetical protein
MCQLHGMNSLKNTYNDKMLPGPEGAVQVMMHPPVTPYLPTSFSAHAWKINRPLAVKKAWLHSCDLYQVRWWQSGGPAIHHSCCKTRQTFRFPAGTTF